MTRTAILAILLCGCAMFKSVARTANDVARDACAVFGAKPILVQPASLVIRLVDEQQKIADFLELMKPFRVVEVNRSGLIAMAAD